MQNDKLRQFSVVFSVVTMIVMNYLSNARAFGGLTNKEISDKYHTLITPAGYAFAIWGIIFLGLLAFAIYQALPSQRTNPRFRAIGWLVVLNTLCNAIWSPLFNNQHIGIALIVILVMLFSLAIIEQRLLMRSDMPIVAPDLDATLPESPASVDRDVACPHSVLHLFWLAHRCYHSERSRLPNSYGVWPLFGLSGANVGRRRADRGTAGWRMDI